nr:chemotaxis protein [Alteribacillus persepolensis]
MHSHASNILLETGTNELEIVMFTVGASTFGINVLKVREIIPAMKVTETPNRHEHLEGIIRLREEVIPVIDLAKVLEYPASQQPEYDKFIIAELNQTKVAFHVHSVSRIHRISWEQIEKPNNLSKGHDANTNGIVKMEKEMALLLDYEKIVMDISPPTEMAPPKADQAREKEREEKLLMIVEDSAVLRQLLEDTLQESGYTNCIVYPDGKEALDALLSAISSEPAAANKLPDAIITDIEMPRMDGHHLTMKVTNHQDLQHIPVIIFSSLITEDLFHKGEKVGASAQVSKPEIVQLVDCIDQAILD